MDGRLVRVMMVPQSMVMVVVVGVRGQQTTGDAPS